MDEKEKEKFIENNIDEAFMHPEKPQRILIVHGRFAPVNGSIV